MLLAHLLEVLLELRSLCRRQDIHDLLMYLIALGLGRADAVGVGLAKFLHDLRDLRLLGIRQIQILEHPHHAVPMGLPLLAGRWRARRSALLCEDGRRSC